MRASYARTTKELWLEYVAFLEKNVPASFANLAPGATEATLAQLDATLGVTLPESVKDVWRLNDGQKATMLSDSDAATPCLPTLSFLSTEKVASIWKYWGKVREQLGAAELLELDKSQTSAVPDVIKPRYSSSKWIPLWADPSRADYIGLDFDPGEKGSAGQIINFGRNENTLYVFARDFDDLLVCLLEEIRSGQWKPLTELGPKPASTKAGSANKSAAAKKQPAAKEWQHEEDDTMARSSAPCLERSG